MTKVFVQGWCMNSIKLIRGGGKTGRGGFTAQSFCASLPEPQHTPERPLVPFSTVVALPPNYIVSSP